MSHGGPGAPLVSTASAWCGIVEVLVVLVALVAQGRQWCAPAARRPWAPHALSEDTGRHLNAMQANAQNVKMHKMEKTQHIALTCTVILQVG